MFSLNTFLVFEWADKDTGEGLQLSCLEFSLHIYCLNRFLLKKIWNHIVLRMISKLSSQDYKMCLLTGTYKGLLFTAFVHPQLNHKPFRNSLFYHCYHENILLVCARVIRQLIYCITLHTPVSNLICKRGFIAKLYPSKGTELFFHKRGRIDIYCSVTSSRIVQIHWCTPAKNVFLIW